MKLSPEEIAFIIEALRYWQRDMDMDGFKSDLSSDEIDSLCEKLNFG
jgi:pullulanase/glycogen debranching enzyme